MVPDLVLVPSNQAEWARWAYANMTDHVRVRALTQTLTTINLAEYVLYPVGKGDRRGFAERHAQAHFEANGALGLSGRDLTYIPWDNQQALADWMSYHWLEHAAWGGLPAS